MTTSVGSLILLDQPWELTLHELAPGASLITGTSLQRLESTFMVRSSDTHERLLDELTEVSRGDGSISDTNGNHWKVILSDYSYQSAEDPEDIVYTHRVQLKEKEVLELERIEFEGLSFTPERWDFEAKESEPVVLSALVTLTAEEHLAFEEVLERSEQAEGDEVYFPVRLVGIDPEPVVMRFGHCLWQRLEEGAARHLLIFVSKRNDGESDGKASPFALLGQPAKNRAAEQAIIARRKVDLLIEELRTAGVLDDATVDRIHTKAKKIAFEDNRELDRAPDVEAHFD